MNRPVDKNLFYRVKRANRIGPQLQGNYISFDLQAKQQVPRATSGGLGDQNLFYRVKARRTPTFQKRIISDLDPLTRIIGQIPRTAGQRRAAKVLSALETISDVLSKFLSTPELNPDGSQKFDPRTGLPIVKLRNISEILEISHQAVIQAFKVAGVKMSQNIEILVKNMTTDEIKFVMERLQSIERVNPSQDDRDKLYPDVIIKQSLKDPGEEKEEEKVMVPPKIEDAQKSAVLDQPIHLDPMSEFNKAFVKPAEWAGWGAGSDKRRDVQQFIMNKLQSLSRPFVLTVNGLNGSKLGFWFSKGHYLDLNELRFTRKEDVPVNER